MDGNDAACSIPTCCFRAKGRKELHMQIPSKEEALHEQIFFHAGVELSTLSSRGRYEGLGARSHAIIVSRYM